MFIENVDKKREQKKIKKEKRRLSVSEGKDNPKRFKMSIGIYP